MRLSISLNPVRAGEDPARILAVAREAERLRFDAVSMSGQVLDYPAGSSLDPIALLSTVAGATERLGLLTSVLVAPAYNPIVLANQAATLDVLSGGRLTLGVGVGFNPVELGALGVPFRERGRRADEHLAVMRTLWSDRPATFAGRYTAFDEVVLGTEPLTHGGPPIWVGGHSAGALRRALRFGTGWIGVGVDPPALRQIKGRLGELGAACGRDPSALELNSVYFLRPPGMSFNGFLVGRPLGGPHATAEGVADELRRAAAAGIGLADLIVPVAPGEMLDAIRWVASEVVPLLGARVSGATSSRSARQP